MNRLHIFLSATGLAILLGQIRAADPAGHGDGKAEAAAKDAAAAIKTFQTDKGVKIELWANEPQLANGVAFAPDEKGRWYVAESYRQEGRHVNGKPVTGGVVDNRGHMNWLDSDISSRSTDDRLAMMRKFYPDAKKFTEAFETYEERIVLLEDTKGAGRADKSTVFADGFREALDGTGAGIIARGNEVWWTCIPSLWRFQDANGDGKAEVKDRMLSGFGVKFAFRGHDMHGLRFGPDGKLYFSIGDRALNVKSKEGRQWEVSDTGAVLRCNPDGTEFEVFATGLRNPQELAFDELGNLFTGDNNSDAGDRARFVQLVEGGDCGWRMTFQYLNDRGPWIREMLWEAKDEQKAKYLIPPIANISEGPSGLTYNPGTGLSSKYAGRFFLSDFRGGASGSVVHQIGLEPAGAWFKAKERRDFIKGILTTDVEFGPDGSLYVLDWVTSWSGEEKGRIYKFSAGDADVAKQAEVKKLLAEGMAARGEPELEKLLAHADMRIRQGAQFQLAAKGAVGPLTTAAQKGSTLLARVHGVWGLGQLAGKKPEVLKTVAALLGDGEGEVRAQAARVLGDERFTGANEALVALLKDGHARARFYAALALAKSAHKGAVEPLFAMLAENADKDPILRHGGVMGLMSCADPEQLAAKSGDPSPAVRVGALLALRRQKSPLVASFLHDPDEKIVLEGARAIYDTPIDAALPALAELTADPRLKDDNLLLRVVNAHYRLGQPDNARTLAAYAANPGVREGGRREALAVLAAWANPNAKDRLTFAWRPLPARGPEAAAQALAPAIEAVLKSPLDPIRETAATTAARLKLLGAGDALFGVVADLKAGKTARAEALRALVSFNNPKVAEAARLALTDSDQKLRAAGLKALVVSDAAAALKVIDEVLSSKAGATEKQGAIQALAESKTPEAEKLLGGLMDALIAGKLVPEVQLDVYEAIKDRKGLAGKTQQWKDSLPKNDPLANYKLSLAGGDAARGKKLFREHATAQCFRCHKCEGGDSLVGPDLSNIGAEKDRAYLLESIIVPNRTIAQGFQIVVLSMKNGSTVAGRLLSEANGKLQVETVNDKGQPQIVPVDAAQIKERTSAASPMLENIRELLSRSELRDIIEYLATRKVPRK